MNTSAVFDAEVRARAWCEEVGVLKEQHGRQGVYIFGDKPSILDAYATSLVAHLMDLGRDDLIANDTVRHYAMGVMSTLEWCRTTAGRRTIWEEADGPVSRLSPI